jgi:hypothetical protein
MRLKAVLSLAAVTACATGAHEPGGTPKDLTIGVVLVREGNKCVVRFADASFKHETKAIAWTDHAVIWEVRTNGCGELKKISRKALGLKHLKLKATGAPAAWRDRCSGLDFVPARIHTPLPFRCHIPSAKEGNWEGVYEYEIDGDSVEPVDPGVDVRRNG